ncbi:GGDEF domain-containing protein [Aquipuribacter sp. MA13-6]|uniref:GGDEF domain-containing protein n=1 Tax=unclassified Aquipuribacter TaxID=2635084 RepID=UPI003EEC3417
MVHPPVDLLQVQPRPRPLPAGVDLGAAVVAATTALVCVVGTDGRILMVNPALEQVTGWHRDEVVGRHFWDVLVAPEDAVMAQDCVARAVLQGEAPPQEGDWLDRRGGRRRIAMTNGVLLDDAGLAYAVVFLGVDVTAQRRAEEQLRTRATRDALTGLPNRDTVLRAVQDELADPRSPGCGVLFGDLDGFKAANDTHGHEVGDLLLRAVADRLLEVTAATDVVARYGGDEFVVLCRGADAHRTHEVRSAVEASVDVPFVTPQGLVHLGMSVGVALGTHGDPADQLIASADRHMYGLKTRRRAGRERRDTPRRPDPATA